MKVIKIVSLMLSVVILSAYLLIGCAPKPSETPTGVMQKPEYISIVYNSDISGPLAALTESGILGFQDVTEYINNELGGVDGVPWKVTLLDTQGKVDACVSNFTKIKEMQPRVLGMSLSSSDESEALLPLTREAKITTICAQSVGSLYPVGYQFSVYPIYPDCFGYFVDWLMKNWKGTERPRVAFLGWDSAVGKSIMTDEVYAYAKEKGVDIVATELFPVLYQVVDTQLTKIKATNPDWIYSQSLAFGALTVAKGVKKMGLDCNLIYPIMGCLDTQVVALDPEVCEGTYFVGSLHPPTDYTNEGVQIARRYFDKSGRPEKMWSTVLLGNAWCVHMKLYEAIKLAVDTYGWEKLDGEHVRAAMETFEDKPIFYGAQIVTYTPNRHSTSKAFIGQIKDGKHINLENNQWHEIPDLRPAEFKPK